MAARRGKKERARTRGFAPSGDIESMEKMEASDEAKAHQPSDVDAMGQDKRRQVVGHSYGPSRKSQFIFFAIVAAVVVIVIGGYAMAIAAFDQPEDDYPAEAPWSDADAKQIPTRSPSDPCGEPGNPYPVPTDSPCAEAGVKAEARESEGPIKDTVKDSGGPGSE
jgi:hypothetical protein